MGYELYRHVLDHAPAELDSTARFILAVIADDANDDSRVGYIPNEVLAHRSGARPETIQKALRRLANAGYEIRVPLGADKDGRPFYAARGRRTIYRIPRFPERADLPKKPGTGSDLSEGSSEQEAAFQGESPELVPRKPGTGSAKPGTSSAPSPQSPHTSPHIEDAREDDGLFGEPTTTTKPNPTKATPAPDTFDITDPLRAWAKDNVPAVDLDFETQKFLNHHGAKGSTFKDWNKAWRNWMLNARQFAEERQKRQGHLSVVSSQPSHDPRYAPGTGSHVDPNPTYSEDPKVVFGLR